MNWLTSRCAPLVTLSALALVGCDKGTDLDVDLPNTTAISTEYQDFMLDVATMRISPVQTLKTDRFLVGRLSDNLAGTTVASAYLNTIVGSPNDSLPSKLTRAVLDSVVLTAGFDKVNGSTTTPAKLDVFNLAAPLDEREAYNSFSAVAKGAPLGTDLVSRLDRTQRLKVDTTAASPFITVPDQTVRLVLQRTAAATAPHAPAPAVVSTFFSTDFFDALRGTGFTQAQLDSKLKGVVIAPSASYSSGIINFGRPYRPRITLFFHDDAATTPATRRKWRSYSVFFGALYSSEGGALARDPRYFTRIKNLLAGTPLAALSDSTRAVSADATLLNTTSTGYIQEGVGLGTRITFKGLEQLMATPGLTVNRAELRVPVKPYTNILYSNPGFIYALEVDARNQVLQRTVNFISTDRLVQAEGANPTGVGSPAVGSLLDATSIQPYYSLPLTTYLQAYLTNKLDGNPSSLVLVPNVRSSSSLSLNRAALDAANIRLRVYFSKR